VGYLIHDVEQSGQPCRPARQHKSRAAQFQYTGLAQVTPYHVDQFFRVEEGEARFVLNGTEQHVVPAGEAAVVPAGTYHNVINTSATHPLKLYTVYSPPNHPDGTIHKTKAEAQLAEEQEH
jgi:mannose-6-phosphate isomerase-like protein (cupin superfamily)